MVARLHHVGFRRAPKGSSHRYDTALGRATRAGYGRGLGMIPIRPGAKPKEYGDLVCDVESWRRAATCDAHRTAFCIIIASFIVQGPFGHPPPLGRIAPTDTVPIRSISCHWCRAVVWVWRGSCPSWRLASKLYVARSRAIQEPSNRALPLATTPMRWARNTIGAGTIDQGAVTGPMPDLTAPKAFISVVSITPQLQFGLGGFPIPLKFLSLPNLQLDCPGFQLCLPSSIARVRLHLLLILCTLCRDLNLYGEHERVERANPLEDFARGKCQIHGCRITCHPHHLLNDVVARADEECCLLPTARKSRQSLAFIGGRAGALCLRQQHGPP